MEDEFEYCEICKDPLTDEDLTYEGICDYCGDGNLPVEQCVQQECSEMDVEHAKTDMAYFVEQVVDVKLSYWQQDLVTKLAEEKEMKLT